MKFSKYVLPVVVGTMGAMMLIFGGEWLIHNIYPLPTGIDRNNQAMLAQAVKGMPATVFVLMLVNYMLCSLAGGLAATLIGGRRASMPAIAVGLLLTMAGVFNTFSFPYPSWFMINMILYFPFSYAGFLIGKAQ